MTAKKAKKKATINQYALAYARGKKMGILESKKILKRMRKNLKLAEGEHGRLRNENKELIDLIFVKDDKIRELLLLQKFVDDGHAFRIASKLVRVYESKNESI